MKYKLWIIISLLIAIAFLSCKGGGGSQSGEVNFDRDASYALGLNIGANLKEGLNEDNLIPNIDEFIKGLRDGITGKEPRFSLHEARERIKIAYDAVAEIHAAEAVQKENEFLAENARKPGVNITSSGLQYEIITERTGGQRPTEQDIVLVHYEGKFINGKFFDSTYTRGQPQAMELDYIIPGWSEGVQLMTVGSKYILYVPSALAYGEEGFIDNWSGEVIIPPFSTLIFEVELLEINPN